MKSFYLYPTSPTCCDSTGWEMVGISPISIPTSKGQGRIWREGTGHYRKVSAPISEEKSQ